MKSHILVLAFVLALASLTFAATCASKAYGASCAKCGFDKEGRMNQECFQAEQAGGVTCLFAAYPLESISYQSGDCPAVDVCKERLETCKAVYSSGNDKEDCDFGSINRCFRSADSCVAYAVKNCKSNPPGDLENIAPDPALCDSVFFMVILPFVLIFNRRVQ